MGMRTIHRAWSGSLTAVVVALAPAVADAAIYVPPIPANALYADTFTVGATRPGGTPLNGMALETNNTGSGPVAWSGFHAQSWKLAPANYFTGADAVTEGANTGGVRSAAGSTAPDTGMFVLPLSNVKAATNTFRISVNVKAAGSATVTASHTNVPPASARGDYVGLVLAKSTGTYWSQQGQLQLGLRQTNTSSNPWEFIAEYDYSGGSGGTNTVAFASGPLNSATYGFVAGNWNNIQAEVSFDDDTGSAEVKAYLNGHLVTTLTMSAAHANALTHLGVNSVATGSDKTYFDSFFVAPVPEPAALSVFGLTTACLVMRRR